MLNALKCLLKLTGIIIAHHAQCCEWSHANHNAEADVYTAVTDLVPEHPPGILALHGGAVLSGKLLHPCSVLLFHQGLMAHAHK